MPRSDLPFGSEFSPSQTQLTTLLELAVQHAGDWHAFEAAVRARYFDAHTTTSESNRRKLANNTRLGMMAYGIYDRQAHTLTEFGKRLYDLRADQAALHDELARHILLNLHGMTLIQCVQDMQAAGEKITLAKLRMWLEERGIVFPRGGKHPSMMRLWLEKAGLLRTWRVDEKRLKDLLGLSTQELDALSQMTPQQRAYLKALANLGGDGPFRSNEVEKLAAATYGVQFNEKGLPKDVLYPLEQQGYLRLERGTRRAGRGAKPFIVVATDKLVSTVVRPLLEQMEKGAASDLRPLLRKPIGEVLGELESHDRHVSGLALEALAFKLMRLIDLSYVTTRLRAAATGGAEVDLIFESDRLVFSRWQVQCKNTARVTLDSVAKEVGLVHMLKSNVIVVVSTGQIGADARHYADVVMKDSNLAIVMIDHQDLQTIEQTPTSIVDVFNREARSAMRIKKLQIEES